MEHRHRVCGFGDLVRLVEQGRFWDVEFEALSRAEQVFRTVWELSGDVDNGGFDQYFFNSAGDTAFAVVDALEAIGARKAARIAAGANAVFPGAAPPRIRAERQALLDALTEEDQARLRELDELFYEEPDDLTALLHGFVLRHASEIEGAERACDSDLACRPRERYPQAMDGGKERTPDLRGPDAGPHAGDGVRPAATAWALALMLGLFAVGAALLGIGIALALGEEAERAWEAVSLLLLGLMMLLMSWATRREALGRPVGWGFRIAVSGLALTAAAIHFLLV